jgi:hypothetical protein
MEELFGESGQANGSLANTLQMQKMIDLKQRLMIHLLLSMVRMILTLLLVAIHLI